MDSSTDNSLTNKSTGSHSSARSHSIRGVVNPANSAPGNKGKGKVNPRSVPRTLWTPQETSELVRLLLSHHASAGDNNFKEETFNKVAIELNEKFPLQRVSKTGKSCRSKWAGIKSEYILISEIRGASGFHYDDAHGTFVDDHTQPAWSSFCKSHPGAAKYKNNPWPYWNDILPLMPTIAKGTHMLHPTKAKSRRGQKKSIDPTNTAAASTIPAASLGPSVAGPSGVQLTQPGNIASAATTDSNFDVPMSPPNAAISVAPNPNLIPPSTPSSYLPPHSAVSMGDAMTSVSQKRKIASTAGSCAGSQTSKRSRPGSSSQRKTEKDAVLQKLTDLLDIIDPSALQPVTLASLGLGPSQMQAQIQQSSLSHDTTDDDYIDLAARVLTSFNLTPFERNAIADYMIDVQNKRRVKFFLTFDQEAREMWIRNTLAEIQAKKDSEKARESMDHEAQQN